MKELPFLCKIFILIGSLSILQANSLPKRTDFMQPRPKLGLYLDAAIYSFGIGSLYDFGDDWTLEFGSRVQSNSIPKDNISTDFTRNTYLLVNRTVVKWDKYGQFMLPFLQIGMGFSYVTDKYEKYIDDIDTLKTTSDGQFGQIVQIALRLKNNRFYSHILLNGTFSFKDRTFQPMGGVGIGVWF